MGSAHFKCYKISLKLPLDKIVAFFDLHEFPDWKDYITLDRKHISKILQYDSESKIVYLYKFGCVCFVDFYENEIYSFLQYIESMIGSIDFIMFSKFNASHTENMEDSKLMSSNAGYINTICFILARSVELDKLERDLDDLLDKAEKHMNLMQSEKLRMDKKVILTAAKILRLEYHYANNIQIFERNIYDNENIESRASFDKLSKDYELDERRRVIQSKMEDIRKIMKAYSFFSYKQRESRTLWLEIALLSLFPLSYVLEVFNYKDMLSRLVRILFA
jgi:required for meiotic nuclear division protein 1